MLVISTEPKDVIRVLEIDRDRELWARLPQVRLNLDRAGIGLPVGIVGKS